MTLALRLARLEGRLDLDGSDLRRLTDDELQLTLLDVCRFQVAQGEGTAEELAACAADIAQIEGGIRAQAELRRRPEYGKHLAYVQGGHPDYVPAVCGDFDGTANGMVEYADLAKPDIMGRRAAIWARPDVQALCATPA